ncbi:GNAT family N-acetyltransferase [Paenibacillus rhizosphaerae]|uniref:GNAT family N-acetyltransferase n=2 Tax=Paenibacillus TaxID=44249 RepID=A0A1R1F107_9BACL|nr:MULTISPECIES: GNAT family N-acetyltransferase [Paenibacillus]OMF57773.1 GNAT family N-acetyltransferase [Paenibacillus rhizosphaerae]OXL83551.1 GNAT family acetyltransferase [Paenibacillus sp. SSG-1]
MEVMLTQVNTEEEIAALADLAYGIWHEYFIRIITRDQIKYMVDKFQSVPAITDQIQHQGYEYFFINVDGAHAGYIGVKQEEGKLFLSKLYIAKEYRGHGYASRAMEFLTTLCKDRCLSAIWLTVNRHNDSTIAVYEKKGFKTVRTQVADIGNGFVMDDYVMEKPIV